VTTPAGLDSPDEYVRLGPYYLEHAERQPGRTMAEELLRLRVAPTAHMVGSDLLAAGALQAIHDAGLIAPRDISVIGYDDTMAEILVPPMTSIAQPIPELGRNAVTLALEAIADANAETRTMIAATRLVIRNSTAAPRG
jgi:DNA-binding LacI/PurR family transcriptional regulator